MQLVTRGLMHVYMSCSGEKLLPQVKVEVVIEAEPELPQP